MSLIVTASWVDDTEVQAAELGANITDGWLDSIYVSLNPASIAEIWFYAWDAINPDLGANDTPDWICRLAPPSETQTLTTKVVWPGGASFTLGLAWFVGETSGDFGDAVTGDNVPGSVEVKYRRRA